MACPWHISADADYSHAKVAEFIFMAHSRIEVRAYQNKKTATEVAVFVCYSSLIISFYTTADKSAVILEE